MAFIQGEKYNSLDDFSQDDCEWVYCSLWENPVRHKSFFMSMQFRTLEGYIRSGYLYKTEGKISERAFWRELLEENYSK